MHRTSLAAGTIGLSLCLAAPLELVTSDNRLDR